MLKIGTCFENAEPWWKRRTGQFLQPVDGLYPEHILVFLQHGDVFANVLTGRLGPVRGLSLTIWEYRDTGTRERRDHPYRIRIKHVDRNRAFIGFGPVRKRDQRDPGHGRFLDLKTPVFALTNRGHLPDSACRAFGITDGEAVAEQHGVITPENIAYARQDVRATGLLLERLRIDFDRHPIVLLPDGAQSPASIAKTYL